MHSSSTSHGAVSARGQDRLPLRSGSFSAAFASLYEPFAKQPIQVLSIGRTENPTFPLEKLLESPGFTLTLLNDYRELWSSSARTVHAAVMHNSLCSFELAEAARLVRSRWPAARILVIRSGELSLDDPLYDHRLAPPVTPKTLLAALSNLTATPPWGEIHHGER